MKTLVLAEAHVALVAGSRAVNDLVQECFRALALGRGQIFEAGRIQLKDPASRCVVKSAYLQEGKALGIKVTRAHPDNPARHGLPVTNSQIMLVDGETGLLRALMDGVYVTRLRTGAAAAVGARFLARPDARCLAIIGAGHQTRTLLEALAADRPAVEVWVWSRTAGRRERYADEMSGRLGVTIHPVASIEEACAQAEIIATATWSTEPLVRGEWVRPGTFIAAIGADAPGMQELDPDLLPRSTVVVDDLEQCVRMGEINVPVRHGHYRVDQIHATIGEVVAGLKAGRVDLQETTIFDSTGIGLQDVIVADHVCRQATARGIGTWVEL
ncbi:MAG: hypothetical protein A2W26_11375 [Acidobacteria bacterium RBG_16_64_8]|nr:MAG: hypothetical protein A2W26_11375 [Acidobacteria bacterium RBG_16_64_8]